jgi:hypothetical protein
MNAMTNPLEDPVAAVTNAVALLERFLPGLLEQCTDPQATDMAELLLLIRDARTKLYGVEQDTEAALAKAMLSDQVVTNTLRVERYRSAERKAWDHEAWQRDVRQQAIRAAGLQRCHVVTADGEELSTAVLHDLLSAVQMVHAAGAPKTSKATGLRAFGLDPADYCESSPGARHVRIIRMADEAAETEQEGAA